MPRSSLFTRTLLLATAGTLLAAGCTKTGWNQLPTWNQLRGEGFSQNGVDFSDNPRPHGGEGSAGSLSAKAREIERNFGFE